MAIGFTLVEPVPPQPLIAARATNINQVFSVSGDVMAFTFDVGEAPMDVRTVHIRNNSINTPIGVAITAPNYLDSDSPAAFVVNVSTTVMVQFRLNEDAMALMAAQGLRSVTGTIQVVVLPTQMIDPILVDLTLPPLSSV